jgi:signal transduction histidine kinase
VSWAVAAAGWVLAVAAVLRLRSRLELIADAEHELRGPATALSLVCERMRRAQGTGGGVYPGVVDSQLARMRVGLDDLAAARRGRRSAVTAQPQELRELALGAAAGVGSEVRAEWDAGVPPVVADRGRLAQALGNLVANAAEHGDGVVELQGRRLERAVRVEVRNRSAGGRHGPRRDGRGRGLRIAARAAESAGGRIELRVEGGKVVAALELPVGDEGADAA